MEIYIYQLVDPRDGLIKYVGQTNNIKKRFSFHISPTSIKRKTRNSNWLNKLNILGLKPELDIIDIANNEDEADRLECFWIGYYKYIGLKLNNGTNGGQGKGFRKQSYTYVKTKEQIEKQKITLKDGYKTGRIINQNKDKPMSEKQKHKLSLNTSFRNLTKSSIDKRAKTNTGKRRSGRISMLDKNTGKIIKIFEGLTDIDIYFEKVTNGNIKTFLNGKSKLKYPYGYSWEYTDKSLTSFDVYQPDLVNNA